MKKSWIVFFVIVVAVLGLVVFLSTGRKPTEDYDEFARCLSEKGATMYGTYWCRYCKNQKAIFGDSFQYVDYVECTENPGLCLEKGIRGYPTWIIDGKQYPGEQSFERLSELTGCDLND
ncbi:MAG: hypothetical protein ISS48_03235 [Candidatus Aenigmarchaeota archaeon]|nr:hypothetical protein [Candidatus Aenigmarchaeota archaeon]